MEDEKDATSWNTNDSDSSLTTDFTQKMSCGMKYLSWTHYTRFGEILKYELHC